MSQPTKAMPDPCSLCIPGEPRFRHTGGGNNGKTCFLYCGGCGLEFTTNDSGATWTKKKAGAA